MISQKIKSASIIKPMKYARMSQCLQLIINTFKKITYPNCAKVTDISHTQPSSI